VHSDKPQRPLKTLILWVFDGKEDRGRQLDQYASELRSVLLQGLIQWLATDICTFAALPVHDVEENLAEVISLRQQASYTCYIYRVEFHTPAATFFIVSSSCLRTEVPVFF
jgi:hypothetical protein